MSKSRQIKIAQQINFIGAINHHRTVHLASLKSSKDQMFMAKAIYLGPDFAQKRSVVQGSLRKLYGSNQTSLVKPQMYGFDEQTQYIYLFQPIFGISLENIIMHHKKIGKPIEPNLTYSLACKIYDSLNRLKNSGTDFFHKNLKPSNIFYQVTKQTQNEEKQMAWKITECGLLTNYPNKYYMKDQNEIMKNKSNLSFTKDNFQSDLYSLGVILLEMVTLAPIQKIYINLQTERTIDSLEELKKNRNIYGPELVAFINCLLSQKDSIKQVFRQYKDYPPEYQSPLQYQEISRSFQDYYRLIDQDIFKDAILTMKKFVQKQETQCSDIVQYVQKFDPELNFFFTEYEELQMFLANYGVNLLLTPDQKQKVGKFANPHRKLYDLVFYLISASTVNYMEIVKQTISTKSILEAVIKKGIQNYKNRKQFFEAQTGGRQFWKAQQIHRFMSSLGIFLNEKDIVEVVRDWAGFNLSNHAPSAKRNSVKYQQFSKIFKDSGKQLNSSRSKTNRTINSEKSLKQMLEDVKGKVPNSNLVSFFRSFDVKGKWVVSQSIQKELKKYVNIPDRTFKQICEQMWQIAGIVSNRNKILQYITLLNKKRIYEPIQLFKLVLTEKVNETNREEFYKKYQKDDKGWSYLSLMDFNHDQMLDFDERELRLLFNQMDKDNSEYLCQKQLIYQLTGLKEFDLQLLVDKIKYSKDNKRIDLFNLFAQQDTSKGLSLDSPGDIALILSELGLQLPVNHYQALFNKYQRGEKFDYLTFLRYFYTLFELFVRTSNLVIEEYYRGNFEKFFNTGLTHGRRKWNRNSLVKINSDMVLCFSENQIGQIWKVFDPNGDGSLTQKQVAIMLNCRYEEDREEESVLPLNSTQKFFTQKARSKLRSVNENLVDQKREQHHQIQKKKNQEPQKPQIIRKIEEKKLENVATCFVKKSRYNGSLSIDDFCKCLTDLSIPHMRNMVLKQTNKFQFVDPQTKSTQINFVNFLMFICQKSEIGSFQQSKKQQNKQKAEILMIVLREIIKNEGMTTQEIFKNTRKPDKMRLTDYQNFVKKILKVQLYFDDIQATWKSLGDVDYLQPRDIENLLSSKKMDRQRPTPIISQQNLTLNNNNNRKDSIRQTFGGQRQPTDGIQSPHFPAHMRSRRSSRDSREEDLPKRKQPENSKNRWKQERKPRQIQERRQGTGYLPKSNRISLDEKKREEEQKKNQRKEQENKFSSQKLNNRKRITKEQALISFNKKIQEKGSDDLNDLFSKSNSVITQRFIDFLFEKYNFGQQEANKIAEVLSSYGKVKIENVRKNLKSPEKKSHGSIQHPQRQRNRERQRQKPYNKNNATDKPQGRKQNLPQTKTKPDPSAKLLDLKKIKLNVPLIKQHIRIIVNSFSKRFSVHEMEPFFFEGQNTLLQEKFIEKCIDINSSISANMYRKIFLYLKPTANAISSISFKINFSFDEQIQHDESYLPQELQLQIKSVFDKADANKNGFIELNQVETLLGSLGLNETQKQIENYFEKIDQNFDKKISYQEFRTFIQDNIIPYLSDFDEDSDYLLELLKMNDIFRTGSLSVPVIGAIIQRYGVKLNEPELIILSRFLANQNGQITINDLIFSLYYPSHAEFSPGLKSVLYKIRWKRKITFKQIQKIFQSITTYFVSSYTHEIMKKRILTPSSFISPHLSDSMLFYRDLQYNGPLANVSNKSTNLSNNVNHSDILVQLRFMEATGLPIPQNSIKNTILSRTVNITFFDTSQQQAKQCITTIYQIQFDPDIEDVWNFSKNYKSLFIKVGNSDPRKNDKTLILIQFVITMFCGERDTGNNKIIPISCGSCSIPIRDLIGIQSKTSRKYKIAGGIPKKAKDVDKMLITKRKGWRGLINKQAQSELNLQIIPQSKFQQKIAMLAGMPQNSIINRKNLDFYWTFRQFFALRSTDGKRINPDFCYHFLVKTFLLCLDIPDVAQLIPTLWKDKIESKIQNFGSRNNIMTKLLSQLFLVINSKQFQLLPSYPSKSTLANKSLRSLRQKLLNEIFNNIENWIGQQMPRQYKRKKAYGCDYSAFNIQEKQLSIHARSIAQRLIKKN